MTAISVIVACFALALLAFGFAFWTPIYAVPLAILFLLGLGGLELLRRRQATRPGRPGGDVEFTDRDRETLYRSE